MAKDWNFQGGASLPKRSFYDFIAEKIKNNQKILNLGCGIKFGLEETIIKKNKSARITSVDIQNPSAVPSFVNFKNLNIEEGFFLEEFDVVCFFELIEHIDRTDVLLANCHSNLKKGGLLVFSFPNLASIFGRIELALGYQPHILEVSNIKSNYGSGYFGRLNNPANKPVHHVRGVTAAAIKELVAFNNFEIIKIYGWQDKTRDKIFRFIPLLAPLNIVICRKR